MYLGHMVFGYTITELYKILQSGHLRPGIKTGNEKLYSGNKKHLSPYIYLAFYTYTPHFTFDLKLLLDNNFYLVKRCWSRFPNKTKRIIGSSLTEKELDKKLIQYTKGLHTNNSPMNNEIILEKDISLVKYLQKITLTIKKKDIQKAPKTYKKLQELIKRKYPNVHVNIKIY